MLEDTLRTAIAPFGQVLNIQNEMWERVYRYPVANGVRQVNMMLTKHVPSHIVIERQRVVISYDVQPTICYGVAILDIYIRHASAGNDGFL